MTSRPQNEKRPARNHASPPGEAWGYGAAPLIRATTRRASETIVFVSDLHAPYHDEGALSSAFNLIRRVSPDRIVLNGDVNDFFQLSRFNTGLERLESLQAEIDVETRSVAQYEPRHRTHISSRPGGITTPESRRTLPVTPVR